MGLHVDPFLPEPAEEWPGPELPEQRRLVLWNYHRHNETMQGSWYETKSERRALAPTCRGAPETKKDIPWRRPDQDQRV